MKKRNLIVVTSLALMMLNGPALAQSEEDRSSEGKRGGQQRGHKGGFGHPEAMLGRLTEFLELDESQSQSVANIMEAAKSEFEVLRNDMQTNREAMRSLDVDAADYGSELQNLSAESGELAAAFTLLTGRVRGEISAVLTEEQRAQLDERMERIRERGGKRRNRAHPPM